MIRHLLKEIERGAKNALTKKRIISYFMMNRSSTLPDLAKELELSIPTVTKIVMELCDEGLVANYGKVETSEGRPPTIYGLDANGGYFIGVNIRHFGVDMGVINFIGDLIGDVRVEPVQIPNTKEGLQQLCAMIKEFIDKCNVDISRLVKIGVNLGGRVNPEQGYSYSIFNFDECPVTDMMSEALGIPVCIENDTRAMAYGELLCGEAKGANNLLFVNLTWGLGSALVINGELYTGKSGFSGEIGHFPLFNNELLCHCGKKGCLETEISGSAFIRILTERILSGKSSVLSEKIQSNSDVTLDDVIEAIHKEDFLCIEILEEMGQKLGRYLAGMINFLNPDKVIIGGTFSAAGDYLLQPLKSAIRKYSLNLVSKDTKVLASKLHNRAGVIGACLITRNRIFY